jgi:hypothetical protein
MGRRKKHRKMHQQQQQPPKRSTRYQEWLDMVEMCDFPIPNQLKNWRRFFINEERFLDAAEEWLKAKLDGIAWPRIEDDVDKRLMHREAVSPGWSWSEWDDEDYVNAYMGGPQQNQKPMRWWNQLYAYATLPLTPKLPAPVGVSGVNMATVF